MQAFSCEEVPFEALAKEGYNILGIADHLKKCKWGATLISQMNYELAYHITPDIEEGAVKARTQELETEITKLGGNIILSRELKKIHLSYPLEHKHYAYFGVIDFDTATETINEFDSFMKHQPDLLRFIILKKPTVKGELRTLGDHRARLARRVAPTHIPTAEIKKDVPHVEEKKIEKELEDVLEKI